MDACVKRSSCRMRPGSSSLVASTRDPCKRARASRTPSGRSRPSGNAIHADRSESRPKSVMNQGAPAAITGRRWVVGSKSRSAPRSSTEQLMAPRSSALGVASTGSSCPQSLARTTASIRSGSSPQLVGLERKSPSKETAASQQRTVVLLGGASNCHVASPGASVTGGPWKLSSVPRLTSPVAASNRRRWVRRRPCRPRLPARPSLTANRSAKSTATFNVTLAASTVEP